MRQRLTVTVALLTSLGLVAVGITLYIIETRRIDRVIETGLSQEIGDLRALQASGRDPSTLKPFSSADRLLDVFLERNLPDAYGVLFTFPPQMTPSRPARWCCT